MLTFMEVVYFFSRIQHFYETWYQAQKNPRDQQFIGLKSEAE